MKIRTKLTISALLPLGLCLLVGMTVLYTRRLVNDATLKMEAAGEIQQKVSMLAFVSHYYLISREERPREQIKTIQTSLEALLARVRSDSRREKAIIRRLQENAEGVAFLISRQAALWQESAGRTRSSGQLEDRITANILQRTLEMNSDAARLENLGDEAIYGAERRSDVLILLLTVVVSTVVVVISLLIMARISSALLKLQKGTQIIAGGELNYRIPFTARDELAQLSGAFNHMAIELQKTYASLRQEVADRALAEEEAEKFAAQLEASNKELQDFAFVASHDLQEPLRKIQAFGDQLKSQSTGRLDAVGADYVDRMQKAARRMQTLVQALLNYSRVTTRAKPFSETDLKALVRDVADDLEARIEATGAKLDIGDLPDVECDPIQIHQLFQNLMGNALKFCGEEKPSVRVYSETPENAESPGLPSDGTVRIFIQDNGIGFDEKYLDRIFVPFQRLHGREVYEGTGMGLAICRKIVDRHGGAITAKSTPGKGSTFIVTLPQKQPKGETT